MRVDGINSMSALDWAKANFEAQARQAMSSVSDSCRELKQWSTPRVKEETQQPILVLLLKQWLHKSGVLDVYV